MALSDRNEDKSKVASKAHPLRVQPPNLTYQVGPIESPFAEQIELFENCKKAKRELVHSEGMP